MKLYSDFMMGIYLDEIIFMVIPGSLSENILTFLPTPIMRQNVKGVNQMGVTEVPFIMRIISNLHLLTFLLL